MKYMTSSEIRNKWLEFFKNKGHHVEKGASLIPYNDPTLLWINSGVAALKKYMDGSEVPPSKRITNVQKSIRTNDIDNVGYTSRHHTFFEMLGCFSIGDYFRKEIIPWAVEILTSPDYFGLDINKIYVTYNPLDQESRELWIKYGIDPSHLVALETNYWQIGEGPCGPNTEVFYDRGDKYDPEHLGVKLLQDEIENDRYIEIWGIVFSQYNAVNGVDRKDYKELPNKNIDTGAGLERIVSIIQGTETNFETDLFMPIIKEIEKISHTTYEEKTHIAYRVISDHIRCITFALSDGENFSNEGRGYVLRRLLRRAMRYGSTLGIHETFLYKLVPSVVSIYKDFYPEVAKNSENIAKNIEIEEEKFLKTLNNGEALLNELLENTTTLSGEDAFKLYDTYGFPLDLTKEICASRGVKVDEEKFNECMERQKELARSSRETIDSMHKQSEDLLKFDDQSQFFYDKLTLKGKVIGLFKDGKSVDVIEEGEKGDVIFDKTSFYAESGGQVADKGKISGDNISGIVTDVQKAPNKQHLHSIILEKGSLKVGDVITLSVNRLSRNLTMRNHSATHLLQSALTKVLGDHIKQMGSYVCKDYLRFDFTHNEKVTPAQIKEIEDLVNGWVSEAMPVKVEEMPKDEALSLGAKHFFNDKYGDVVRVVTMGDVSMEFCGGTHLKCTDEIGLFKIVSESSIASGVRRIEAKTSLGAYDYIKEKEHLIEDVSSLIGAKADGEVIDRVKVTLKDKENKEEEYKILSNKISSIYASSLKNETIDGVEFPVIFEYLKDEKRPNLLKIGDLVKSNFTTYLIILIGAKDDKYPLIVLANNEKLGANIALKEITSIMGGNGGGKPTMAQGSISDIQRLSQAKERIISLLK